MAKQHLKLKAAINDLLTNLLTSSINLKNENSYTMNLGSLRSATGILKDWRFFIAILILANLGATTECARPFKIAFS